MLAITVILDLEKNNKTQEQRERKLEIQVITLACGYRIQLGFVSTDAPG